jgi:hypothetical protein
MITGEINCQYVRSGKGKKGNLWVQLSDGVEPKFFTTLDLADFEDCERGDTITVEMEIDPFTARGTVTSVR